jgi:hypothetical protein
MLLVGQREKALGRDLGLHLSTLLIEPFLDSRGTKDENETSGGLAQPCRRESLPQSQKETRESKEQRAQRASAST